MTELGLDYSYARPGGAALAAAGVKAVGRYLATYGDGREIEKPEYDDLVANGVGVWFVREGAAIGMLGGYAKGVSDAQIAVANLARLGLSNQVVYAAADWDVLDSQFGVCDDYMRGFASVIGAERTGIYAGLHYMNHAHAAGVAAWFWQAGATSWNHGEGAQMTVHLEQTVQQPPIAGTDHNFIYTANFGQVGASDEPREEEDMSYSFVKDAKSGTVFVCSLVTGNYAGMSSAYHWSLLQRLQKNDGNDPMLVGELDICRAYLRAINPPAQGGSSAPVTPEQIADIATQTAAKIPAAPHEFTITGKAAA